MNKPAYNAPVNEAFGRKPLAGGDGSQTGTSIFDPVLCELVYRWFCPPGGRVLDPFAGGSVRGIVAAKLGRKYVGIELRPEQVAANRQQAREIVGKDNAPRWVEGDAKDVGSLTGKYDLIFTCPPYGDLEVYSDDPRDLSTMTYAKFRDALARVVKASCAMLKPDRFAVIVVGDFRDKKGLYHGFPADTQGMFRLAGLELYNDAVLVTAVGSLPLRVGRQFEAARKLGKTHQNVLVFVKGDPKAATVAVGPVEFGEIETPDGA
jgi:DNA modification methylase